jgi:hypothetical protein
MGRVLISVRLADMPEALCPAFIDTCCICGMAVWHAESSPPADDVVCMQCAKDVIEPGSHLEPPTAEQVKAIKKAIFQ